MFNEVLDRLGAAHPNVRIETRSPAAIKAMVAATQFLGWLPEPLFAAEQAAGLICPIPVRELDVPRRFYLHRRRQNFIAPPVSRFLEELRKFAPAQ
jgi:DNA-binding transcriptional LysR family regulator